MHKSIGFPLGLSTQLPIGCITVAFDAPGCCLLPGADLARSQLVSWQQQQEQ